MFNNSIHKNRIKNIPGRVLIDASTHAKFLNRYLAHVTHKYYDFFHQKNPYYVETELTIQWRNIEVDIKGLVKNPIKFAPQVAYSLAAFWFIFTGEHESARNLAFMGVVAAGNDTDATQTSNSATLTFSHNNNGTVLLVGDVSNYYSSGAAATYAGDNLTLEKRLDDGLVTAAELYSKLSPASGANNVILTWGNSAARAGANAISFTGADVVENMAFSGGSAGTSASTAITSAVGDMVYDILGVAAASTLSAGAGQTEKSNQAHGVSASASSIEDGAASVTMSWSFSLSNYAHIGINVSAAPVPVNSNFLTFMGPQPQV